MRQLRRDITRHPRVAWTFLFCWAALWVWTQLTRKGPTGDIAPVPGVLQLLVPILAGALVGWWRKYDAAKQRSGGQGSAPALPPGTARALGGGTLAGMLLMLADVVILFSVETFYTVGAGRLDWGAGAEVLEWLIGLGIFGSLLGFVGAIVGSGLARISD